jgi:protein disulfide-isomerase
VNILEVDCEDSANKRLCSKEKIDGFPTLRFYNEGEMVEYRSSRSLAEMEEFLKKALAA